MADLSPNRKRKIKIDIKLLAGKTNKDFYPTPSKLAGMMFAGIDFKNVRTVLEPSAGKYEAGVSIFMKDSLIPIVGEKNMQREFPWETPKQRK